MFKSFLSTLPPLALATVGGWLVWFGLHKHALAREELTWPTTKGVVKSSKYISDDSPPDEIRVDSVYEVNGKQREQPIYVVPETRDVIPPAYQRGAEVVIYYNPLDPDKAVLEPGEYSHGTSWIIFGSIVLLLATPWLVFCGLLLYADIMMAVARRHMRKGLELLKEAEAEFQELLDADAPNMGSLQAVRKATLGRAREAVDLYSEAEEERESFEQAEEEVPQRSPLDLTRSHLPADVALDSDAVRRLIGSDHWNPGGFVEIIRPAATGQFVWMSSLVIGAIPAGIVYYFTRNIEGPPVAPFLAAGIMGAIVANAILVYLQGLQPRREIHLDWKKDQVEVHCERDSKTTSFERLKRLVLRLGKNHVQLDAESESGSIRLLESDDFGSQSLSLPLSQVVPLAEKLASALGIALVDGDPKQEPVSFRQIWHRSRPAYRATLITLVLFFFTPIIFQLNTRALVIAPIFVAVVSVIVVPVASGILVGMSWVRQGHTGKANAVGILAMAIGAGAFAFGASGNRNGLWETFPAGSILGLAGTYGGFVLLLFGMGMTIRNSRFLRRG